MIANSSFFNRLLYPLTCVLLLASCTYFDSRESVAILNSAAQAMETNPAQAQQQLRSANEMTFSEADYAYFVLLKTRLAGMNGANIASLEEPVTAAVSFFTSDKGTAPQAAFAHFVLAKVYYDRGNQTQALLNYFIADDWAKKANYQIPNFNYSGIPSNIALLCVNQGRYEESLLYLEKALTYIETENGVYSDILRLLELKALNFTYLSHFDSALHYYDKALEVARSNQDTYSTNRILYNKYALLYKMKDYTNAESRCVQLLPQLLESNDSIPAGATYLMLSLIYTKTNRLDAARESIHRANELLVNSADNIRLSLYETLSLVEQKRGNAAKATTYQHQHDAYKLQLERKRAEEQAGVEAQLKASREEGAHVAKMMGYGKLGRVFRKEDNRKALLVFFALLTLPVLLYTIWNWKNVMRELSGVESKTIPFAEFCTEELLRYAERTKSMQVVMRNVKNCRSDELAGRVAYMLDDLVPPDDWNWRRLTPSAQGSYAELIGLLRRSYPQLTEKELDVCALLYTQRFKVNVMADIVMAEPEDVRELRKSIRSKLRADGYTLRGVQKTVKRFLSEGV